jgi:hypothetical protein
MNRTIKEVTVQRHYGELKQALRGRIERAAIGAIVP